MIKKGSIVFLIQDWEIFSEDDYILILAGTHGEVIEIDGDNIIIDFGYGTIETGINKVEEV